MVTCDTAVVRAVNRAFQSLYYCVVRDKVQAAIVTSSYAEFWLHEWHQPVLVLARLCANSIVGHVDTCNYSTGMCDGNMKDLALTSFNGHTVVFWGPYTV
jgi:hypothetical protein